MEKRLTCIVCPMGCEITVNFENGKVLSVSGNTCPRGEIYAENECISPKRTVTSTVKCLDGSLLSVKTSRPIDKNKMTECMEIINKTTAKLPVKIGDVIIKDVFGCDIIATQNRG